MSNPLVQSKPTQIKTVELRKSAGILDDYAVRKNVATREGTVEKVPVNNSDIVNKKYVDDTITALALATTYAKLNGTNHPFTKVITPIIKPDTDSTTALRITNAADADFVTFDTTNSVMKIAKDQNALTGIQILNNNGSGAAKAQITIGQTASGNNYSILEHLGSGFTTSGVRVANRTLWTGFDTGGCGVGTGTAYPLILFTNNTEYLRILSGGNIGIRTTAPDKALEINSADGSCLRLTYNDSNGSATYYTDFRVDSAGSLTTQPVLYNKQNNLVYGSMYGDDVNITITISVASTYYEVGATLSGGTCNGFTFQNNKELLTLVAGKYKIDWSMTLESATANQYVEGAIMINSTAQSNTIGACNLTSASDKKCVSGSGIITLAVNDVVKLCVENETETNNIIVSHATLSLLRVDA